MDWELRPSATVVELPGLGHYPQVEAPKAYAEAAIAARRLAGYGCITGRSMREASSGTVDAQSVRNRGGWRSGLRPRRRWRCGAVPRLERIRRQQQVE